MEKVNVYLLDGRFPEKFHFPTFLNLISLFVEQSENGDEEALTTAELEEQLYFRSVPYQKMTHFL